MTRAPKAHKTYHEQVQLLAERGMDMGDRGRAAITLSRVNYYRLSGYWYPFRKRSGRTRLDEFLPGTRFEDVVALYNFDAWLRAAAFTALAPVELALRALLGHELGRIDPSIHLKPQLLGPTAQQQEYTTWLERHELDVDRSREEFVKHHKQQYEGQLPIWVAVELLDWGSLTQLYRFAPPAAQDEIAGACGLSAPQLTSWLRALNLIRNICAHHGRLFNRVHSFQPKLPKLLPEELAAVAEGRPHVWSRTFGQLTLIQYLSTCLAVGDRSLLTNAVACFPKISAIPITHTGAPHRWQHDCGPLWQTLPTVAPRRTPAAGSRTPSPAPPR